MSFGVGVVLLSEYLIRSSIESTVLYVQVLHFLKEANRKSSKFNRAFFDNSYRD